MALPHLSEKKRKEKMDARIKKKKETFFDKMSTEINGLSENE